MTHLDSSAKGH